MYTDFGEIKVAVEGFISSATSSDLDGSVHLSLMGKVLSGSNLPPEATGLCFI